MSVTPRMARALRRLESVPGGLVLAEDMIADWADDAGKGAIAFERFHWGDEVSDATQVDAPRVRPGDVLVSLGELAELAYDTTKAGEPAIWTHGFRRPRPTLAHTRDGRLVIVGGGYRITERGIVG